MTINGYGMRDHLKIVFPLLILLTVVWLLRILAFAAGLSIGGVRWISLTVVVQVCVALVTVRIYLEGSGGYANVVALVFILNLWTQLLIALAVTVTLLLGWPTIYSYPTFVVAADGDLERHIYGQLTFVLGFLTLFGSATGCLLLFLLRRLLPEYSPRSGRSR